jgi:hypothetical protein
MELTVSLHFINDAGFGALDTLFCGNVALAYFYTNFHQNVEK